jgi:hypothetical protein
MAADLNYCLVNIRSIQSGQPLPTKCLASSLTGALPFVTDIPARNFCGSQGISTDPWSKVHSKAISRRGRCDAAEAELSVEVSET